MAKLDKAYEATLDYLFSQLPMYQRVGDIAMKKDLGNIIALCKKLKNPQDSYPTIHIAGTNGKGSSTHILAAVLQETGKKVGVYTSPHYKDFRERIKINGTLASKQSVVDFVKDNRKTFDKIQPSFFEITVAMAFQYFADQKVDIAIIETGLGGRLDSTNIVKPILSLITNISLDHQQFLGNTLKEIAGEKAGIIKKDVPVVIAEENSKTASVFKKKAKEVGAPIYFARENYNVIPTVKALTHSIFNIYKNKRLYLRDVESDISGEFQAENLRGIIQVIYLLNQLGIEITDKQALAAFKKVRSSTYFIGRMHVLKYAPFIIADSGHNTAALSITMKGLQNIRYRQLHIVLGFVKDKDITKMLRLFPKNATYYFAQADIPRALPVDELQAIADKEGYEGSSYTSVTEAYLAASCVLSIDDCLFIGGSTFVVAEVL